VKQTVDEFGRIDILVNNAGEQHPDENIGDITRSSFAGRSRRTFSECFI
jgi:NAD(P)-dependent dehydrogenase (short-subunit alcohol dehydrogenase family)